MRTPISGLTQIGLPGAAIVDQVVVSGGNFLMIAICAHLLSPMEQGKVGIVLSTYLVTAIINQTALLQMAAVRAPQEADLRGLLLRLADFQVFLGLATTAVLLASLVSVGDLIGLSPRPRELLVAGAYFLAQQYADFDRRASYVFATPARALASSLLVFPARTALLLLIQPKSMLEAYAIVAATALPPATVTVIRKFLVRERIRERCRFVADHALRSRWLVASTPLAWAWSQVPVYFLGNVHGLVAVGAYVSVRSITNIANIGLELLETHFSAQLARAAHDRASGAYRQMVLTVLAVGGGFWLAGIGVIQGAGQWILGTLVGDEYVQYVGVLTWLWLAALLTFLFKLDSIDARTRGVTEAIPVGYLNGVCFAVAGCFAFLPSFGATGAAMARGAAAIGLLVGLRATRVLVGRKNRTID
jgi:O-antigen/teichoic acid export membrane protein